MTGTERPGVVVLGGINMDLVTMTPRFRCREKPWWADGS